MKVTAIFNPFKNITTITISDKKGNKYLSEDIFGQLTTQEIKHQIEDMTKFLIERGIIK